MKDEQKTKKQLVSEMIKLRRRITELEASESEHRQAEDALRETTDYLDKLFNYANAPIIVWDPDTRITRFNHAFEHLTGYTVAEVIGKKLQILFPESSREESLKKIANTLSGEYWESVEIPILRKDKDIRIALWNSANIQAGDGITVIATIAQGQDITERKYAEKDLKESKERLSLALDVSNSGMWELNPLNFTDTHYNERWFAMLGYESDELSHTGETWTKLMHPDDLETVLKRMKDHIEKNIPYSVEFRMKTKDGGYLWIYSVGKIVSWDKKGNPERMIGLHIDINDRRQAEENLNKSKIMLQAVFDGISDPLVMLDRDLSVKMLNSAAIKYYRAPEFEKVIDRPCFEALQGKSTPCERCEIPSIIQSRQEKTFERRGLVSPESYEYVVVYPLYEKDVGMEGAVIKIRDITENKKIQEQLIRADRLSSLGQLSGGIAHEIRNPLAGINLFLDILSDEDKYERTAIEIEIFNDIRNDVNKIDGIIRRVLDFARPGVKKTDKIDIKLLIREEIKLWSLKIRKPKIDLKLSLKKETPFIVGDSIELRQVINNLVMNSIDAMKTRGVLEISTARGISSFHKDRKVAVITVKDSGSGIKPEQKASIFNPFFTTKADGTGLGLSILYNIIKRHGGTISCESEPGKGTTFTIELPAIREEIK